MYFFRLKIAISKGTWRDSLNTIIRLQASNSSRSGLLNTGHLTLEWCRNIAAGDAWPSGTTGFAPFASDAACFFLVFILTFCRDKPDFHRISIYTPIIVGVK